MQYQSSTGGSTVEKPAKTQTSIWLASHLVRAPNYRSGGREFRSPLRRELGALTKSEKILGVRMKNYGCFAEKIGSSGTQIFFYLRGGVIKRTKACFTLSNKFFNKVIIAKFFKVAFKLQVLILMSI